MKNISIKQLNVFCQIARSGSLSLAAEHLFMSKAAVSLSLTELEKHLGHRVFDRVNQRLHLNHQGYQLLPLADELLQRHAEIELLYAQSAPLAGTLKVGASQTVGSYLLPYLLADFEKERAMDFSSGDEPNYIDKQVQITNHFELCQNILEYKVDVGFTEGVVQHPDLLSLPFTHDEMWIIAAKGASKFDEETIDVKALSGQQWLLREEGSGSRDFFIQHIAPSLTTWDTHFQFNSNAAIINGVTAGLGLSCLSHHVITKGNLSPHLQKISLSTSMQRPFSILLHKNKYQSPLLNCFVEFSKRWGIQTANTNRSN
jgi:DNA-binding transcriptional LysR family regulator